MTVSDRPGAEKPAALFLLCLPPVLVGFMSAAFVALIDLLGADGGYLAGFAIYWALCLGIPVAVLGPQGAFSLLKPSVLVGRERILPGIVVVIAFVATLALYANEALQAPASLALVAVPVGMLNGLCEELLWRGLYGRVFASRPLLAIAYPAVWFGLWHFAPQLVFPSSEGPLVLVASASFLGLAYGWVTLRTGSARWAALSHGVSGVIAMGGAIAPAILRVVQPG